MPSTFSRAARLSALPLAAALLHAPLGDAAAQANVPGPSFQDVISLRQAGSPAISPDGSAVVYTVRSTDWAENRYDTELWMARRGEEPFPLTRTPKGNSTMPRWSPDGRWVAFLADRGDKPQVFVLRAAGGEAMQLTGSREGVTAFRWAPDGRRIAFVAADAEDPALKRRRERYGDFAEDDTDFRQTHLWLVDVDPGALASAPPCPSPADSARADTTRHGGPAPASACAALPAARPLTRGRDFTVSSFAWAPDGRRIAFERRSDPLINSAGTADVVVVDVATGAVRPVAAGPGYEGSPVWSPDGRSLLVSSAAGDTASNFYTNGQLLRVPVDGGAPVRLAADLDDQVGGAWWTPTGIYVLAWNGMTRSVHAVDPNGGPTRRLTTAPEVVTALDISPDGRSAALLGQTATTLPEVYRASTAGWRAEPVTRMSAQIGGWNVGTSEKVSWTSTDGTRIEGVLTRPRDFDPSRKYPLLVVIHGGPTAIDYPVPVGGYVYPVAQWAARGALVLRPNYRGSAGYGERFRALNVRNLGVGDAWDVLSGVDHLVRQGVVDTTRMGVMGWSQGGYISAFLTTTSTRFRAVSVGAGISDWTTYYVNTDIHPFTRQYLKATPWDDPEIYARTSPITYVRQARTPTLIQHGENDRRVPIANAYQLHQALRDRGVPSSLIVYRGFGHGIDKPKEQLAATWHNWQWFERYVWGEEVELP